MEIAGGGVCSCPMSEFHRITIDPAVRFGRPCVRGTRISVGDVLGFLAAGMSESEVLADYPQLAAEDIRECLAFPSLRESRVLIDPAA